MTNLSVTKISVVDFFNDLSFFSVLVNEWFVSLSPSKLLLTRLFPLAARPITGQQTFAHVVFMNVRQMLLLVLMFWHRKLC